MSTTTHTTHTGSRSGLTERAAAHWCDVKHKMIARDVNHRLTSRTVLWWTNGDYRLFDTDHRLAPTDPRSIRRDGSLISTSPVTVHCRRFFSALGAASISIGASRTCTRQAPLNSGAGAEAVRAWGVHSVRIADHTSALSAAAATHNAEKQHLPPFVSSLLPSSRVAPRVPQQGGSNAAGTRERARRAGSAGARRTRPASTSMSSPSRSRFGAGVCTRAIANPNKQLATHWCP